jgi:hypothetical protein
MNKSAMQLALLIFSPVFSLLSLQVGVAKVDITPPNGTPSAGYYDRKGAKMEGIHDPLYAIALYLDNGTKQIALCSVDNLGFTYEMAQEITSEVHKSLPNCEVYIGSSHTHSGGGAFLNIPKIGAMLAGEYNGEIREAYVRQTAEAILEASRAVIEAKIGIGYGDADKISRFRSTWPENRQPLDQVTVIRVDKEDGTPYAALFNYPLHPTVLNGQNRLFSSDFVGYARHHLEKLLGIQAIYFNGAQGDITPKICNDQDRFESCDCIGLSLAQSVKKIWDKIETSPDLNLKTRKLSYSFKPEATPFGTLLPISSYQSELNLLVLNQKHAIITIPGELSSVYDERLKKVGLDLGFTGVSFFGLTNDAHGYIILPEAFNKKTSESGLSFGGEFYGKRVSGSKSIDSENSTKRGD